MKPPTLALYTTPTEDIQAGHDVNAEIQQKKRKTLLAWLALYYA